MRLNLSNFGAVRHSLLSAAVLAILAVPLSAQVVERGRTFDDLTSSHPCSSGLTDRIARVTDCDGAATLGDGGGAFQCWAYCDGTAPWADVVIGASGEPGPPGPGSNTFETIDLPAGTDPVADSGTDTLTVTCAAPLVCTGTAGTDTWAFTIGAPAALAANGANCSAGNYPLGVDAAGAVESCTAALSSGGNIATATALAANGANCSAGSYPLGVNASGAVEDCTVAGGGAATAVQGDATLPATCTEKDLYQDTDSGGTEFYVCTAANTWTKAGTGTIGGTLGATDNVAVCSDGTGGSTIGACSGQILIPDGTFGAPGIAFASDPDTGIYPNGNDSFILRVGTNDVVTVTSNGITSYGGVNIGGTGKLSGFSVQLFARDQGVGSPLDIGSSASSQWSTNEGATAEVYVNLPAATDGLHFTACVNDADGFRYTAASGDTIRVIDKVTAAAGYISSTTVGSCVTLTALNATEWFAHPVTGTWTDGTFTYSDTSLTTP